MCTCFDITRLKCNAVKNPFNLTYGIIAEIIIKDVIKM